MHVTHTDSVYVEYS